MSIAEGLASTDVAKIKAARGAAKGQVTKNVNILQDNLVVENDKFLYDEIDDKKVEEVVQKLDSAYDQFVDLHERFLRFRTKEADQSTEKENLKQEEEYSLKVRNDYKTVKRSCMKYKRSIEQLKEAKEKIAEESARGMKVALLTDVVETSKKKLDSIKKSAKVTIESTDENVLATAGLIKEELTEALANYESKVAEYKAASIDPRIGQGEEKFNVATDFTLDTLEFDEIMELKFKLSALSKKTNGLGESNSESSSGNQYIAQPIRERSSII